VASVVVKRNEPIVRIMIGLLLLACSGPMASCGRGDAAPAQREIDFAQVITRNQKAFAGRTRPTTKKEVADQRSRQQDELFQEFDSCPQCFVKKFSGTQRTYLFDAITDCSATMRLGSLFDGGKWICDPPALPDSAIVYSFGIGDNISFDMDMAGRLACNVYMFDPSPSVVSRFKTFLSGQACGKGRMFYQPVGLGPVSGEAGRQWNLVIEGKACKVESLSNLARSLRHDHVDVLKIDIEGGEMAALRQVLASQTLDSLRVRQLLVEFHLWDDKSFEDFVRIVGALKKSGFLIFRKEFNPYAADKCAEFSFVRG
jgi:FkbM family methyltransferase